MDKSLAFFIGAATPTNPDSKTGMSTQIIEGTVNINYYSADDPTKSVKQEQKKYSYNAVISDQNPGQYDENGKYIAGSGQFINYLGNSQTNEYEPVIVNNEQISDIALSSIIDWTTKHHKSMALLPKHFAYLKNFGSYPANRLIVLRRFAGPAPHNLFKSNAKPISTLVGFYDFENIPVKISFNEKWKQFDSTFLEVIQDIVGIKFDSIPGVGDVFSKVGQSPIGQDLMYMIGQRLGIISGGSMPYGDPNLIHDAAIRDVSGEGLSTGLESNIDIDFETTFTMNEILGIDAKAAMLDILANATKMGTSNARFLSGNSKTLANLFTSLKNGDVSEITDAFVGAVTETVQILTEKLSATLDKISELSKTKEGDTGSASIGASAVNIVNASFDLLKEAGYAIIANRFKRYKWKLIGAVSAMTGSHTAPWHISIGNPKFPWFVCGNLVAESTDIIPGGELGYNDMFTELTVKIKLKSGRAMGGSEIQQLFNAGVGRIYDTPKTIQTFNVVEGTIVNVPGDGRGITITPPSKNDKTNSDVDPADLNPLPQGTANNFTTNNTPGEQGETVTT